MMLARGLRNAPRGMPLAMPFGACREYRVSTPAVFGGPPLAGAAHARTAPRSRMKRMPLLAADGAAIPARRISGAVT